MINFIIILAIILLFIRYDIVLRIRIVIHRDRVQDILQEYAIRTVRHIVSLVRAYGAFRLEYEDHTGQPLPERFLLVSNHQSLLDIPILMYLFSMRRLRFVAKKELGAAIPLVSFMLRAQGQALISRHGDPAQAMQALVRYARRCRRDGTSPVIFPEGTRSRDGRVGEFHRAGVRRVLEVDELPVVIVAIEGGSKVSSLGSLLKNLRGTRFSIHVVAVLPPPIGKKAIQDLVRRSQQLVTAELERMRAGATSGAGVPRGSAEPAAAFPGIKKAARWRPST